MIRFGRTLLLIAPFVVAPSIALADVKGSFEVSGKSQGKIVPTHAAAFESRSQRDPRQKVAEVVLSERAVDVDAAAQALQPHTHVINQEALSDRNYVLLWVAPDGHVSMNATFGKTMTQFVDAVGDSLQATLTVNTAERVAGRVFTTKAVKTMNGDSYSVDLTFDTAVTRLPAGKPLGDGGGAPGKALATFLDIVKKRQWPAIKEALGPSALKMFDKDYNSPEDNAASVADILQNWLPKAKLKIVGGEDRGDSADLEIEGEMFPDTPAFYLARMTRSGSTWQFDGATMIAMLP